MSNNVLAIAAGKEITSKDIDTFIQRLPQQQQVYASNPQFRAQALQQLINMELFKKQALEEKLEESEAFKSALAEIKDELLSNMYLSNAMDNITVSEEEKQAFYEANKMQFIQQASVSAKHILTEDEEGCLKAAKEIETGEKTFEEAAKAYSTCPSGEQGGDLGAFGKGQMVKEFEEAAFNGELNTVLGPVKTQFGYHLIYVYAKQEEETKAFEDVKDQVEKMALQQKQHKAYDKLSADLAEKFGVEKK